MLVGWFIGSWEVILILAILIILFCAKHLPPMAKGLRKGIDEFKKGTDEVTREVRDLQGRRRPLQEYTGGRFSVRLLVARGFGIGLIPFAPGTFGSLLGMLWFAMLIASGNFWAYLSGALEGVAFSIWLCDEAEKMLEEKDPSSVVLDEIIAIPFCFLPWIANEWFRRGELPPVKFYFEGHALLVTAGIVVLFRVFDIWKPWPVRQIQRLPGGWGITADDLLAAGYVMLVVILFFSLGGR